MTKVKEEKEVPRQVLKYSNPAGRPYVVWDGIGNVLINHASLDHLIGRLMEICDLMGDGEQRKAFKDQIKRISRDWLNENYHTAGYRGYELEDDSMKIDANEVLDIPVTKFTSDLR